MPFRKVSKWIEKLRKPKSNSNDIQEEADVQNSSELLIGVQFPDEPIEEKESDHLPTRQRHVTMQEDKIKFRRSSTSRKSVHKRSITIPYLNEFDDMQDGHFPTSSVHVSSQKSVAKNVSDRLRSSKSLHSKSSNLEMPETRQEDGILIAAPITDSSGRLISNLELGEALTLLMKKGIIERPIVHTSPSAEYLKHPSRMSGSSSEPSNAELVISSIWQAKRPKLIHGATVQQSKSEPIARITMDQCVNTSVQELHPIATFDDSIVQLKFKRYLTDDSCTQYFALRSSIQLEPYIQEMRQREAERRQLIANAMASDQAPDNLPEGVVLKQRGKLVLSRASVESKDLQAGQTETADSEYQMKVTNLQSDVATALSNTIVVPPVFSQNPNEDGKTSSEIKLPCCRTCHPSEAAESPIRDTSTEETQEVIGPEVESDAPKSSSMFGINQKGDNVIFGEGGSELQMIFEEVRPSTQLVNLSMSSYNIIEESKNFMFTWNFLKNFDSLYFSLENVKENQAKVLSVSRVYKFDMTPGVYLFLLKCPMAIELFNVTNGGETLIGKCNLKLNRCFADISNIYESTILMQNRDLCLCYVDLAPMHFGKLVIRFRMRGTQAQFDKCRPAKVPFVDIPPLIETREPRGSGHASHDMFAHSSSNRSSERGERGNIVSEAELQAFRDGLNLVLVRNKALRTTQEEITQELKDRTNWMHEELKWKLTLQENAILSGKDPETIKWRQWKDDTTANVRYRPISHEEFLKDGIAHVEIEILELVLYPESKPMLNDNLSHLYIELAFLDMSGRHMETLTMHKPVDDMQSVRFHFKRVFDIHVETRQSVLLAEMIRNNDSIPFNLIAQPIEYRNELQSCYDIGIANLVLFDLLQSRQNTTVEAIPVHDAYNKDVTIGMLKIRFVGVLAMRSMALHILTPQTFKIIR